MGLKCRDLERRGWIEVKAQGLPEREDSRKQPFVFSGAEFPFQNMN